MCIIFAQTTKLFHIELLIFAFKMFHGMFSESTVNESYNNSNIETTLNNSMTLPMVNLTQEAVQEANTKNSDEENADKFWPDWATKVKCISHLMLTLYSSATFLIYYIKQKTSGSRGEIFVLILITCIIHF